MTPNNDKTLRGLFHEPTIGVNEMNDRREYRLKYGQSQIHIGNKPKRSDFMMMALASIHTVKTLIHDDKRGNDEYVHHSFIAKLFPESKIGRQHMGVEMAYGYGNPFTCDRCGKKSNPLDMSFEYSLCNRCDNEMEYERNGLLRKMR